MADEFIAWDHESDNQWREDNKKMASDVEEESVDELAVKVLPVISQLLLNLLTFLLIQPFDVASVIKVQSQVRGWLARREAAKLSM